MVAELYDKPVILVLVIETIMPTVYVPNIQAIPNLVEVPIKKTQEKRREIKRRRSEEKDIEKKAKVTSLLDEQDLEARVHEIATEASGLIPPTIDAERDGVVPPTTTINSVPTVNGIIFQENRTRPVRPYANTA